MKIAMVASEINPLVKSGGLADVVYSLSKELVIEGEEVIDILPFYNKIWSFPKLKVKRLGSFDVYMSWRKQSAEVYRTYIDGITYCLIGNDYYFNRDAIYGFNDDGERFAFFALAAKKLLKFVNFEPDIVHVHDWQAAMLPVLIKEQEKNDPFYNHIKCVLTIHNPAFKGMIDRYFLNNFYGLSDELYDNGSVRFENMVSTLKAGIIYADKITTVSPNHAKELLTPEGSQGLSGVLSYRKDDFEGILNGIDTAEFNPASDSFIPKNYTIKSVSSGKAAARFALLKATNLTDNGGPLYGFVSRLTFQKGVDLILHDARYLLDRGALMEFLGSGEYQLEQALEQLRAEYPCQVGIYIGYNNERAHQIYAASDFFLMPSLFEPCGIGQMIAQRYGSLPIVRYTGGLRDTVIGFNGDNSKTATGLGFETYDDGGLLYACSLAQKLFDNKDYLRDVVANAMALDHSWVKASQEYLKVYQSLLK
jgi:starch synthase